MANSTLLLILMVLITSKNFKNTIFIQHQNLQKVFLKSDNLPINGVFAIFDGTTIESAFGQLENVEYLGFETEYNMREIILHDDHFELISETRIESIIIPYNASIKQIVLVSPIVNATVKVISKLPIPGLNITISNSFNAYTNQNKKNSTVITFGESFKNAIFIEGNQTDLYFDSQLNFSTHADDLKVPIFITHPDQPQDFSFQKTSESDPESEIFSGKIISIIIAAFFVIVIIWILIIYFIEFKDNEDDASLSPNP